MPVPPTFDARLVGVRALSRSVRELTFERINEAPFDFEAGQWISLVLPLPDGEVRRAYSIASPPDGSPRFQLAVTHVLAGPGSTYLHGLEIGATLKAVGPQGFFTRPRGDESPSLFIATGTGVVPFRSMMRAATMTQAPAPLWLLFGVREEADILWRDELDAMVGAAPQVRIEVTLSRPSATWSGRRGYVQEHVRELWTELAASSAQRPLAPRPHVYVCGLEKMVGSVRDLLKRQIGLPRQQIHSERYD